MKDLTIIIPIHEWNDNISALLKRATESIVDTEATVAYVGPAEVIEKANEVKNGVTITNSGNTDFASQINLAASNVKTTYFSILEFDDVYTDNWFRNVEEYIGYLPEVSVYLPITKLVSPELEMAGFMNEVVWATSFSDEVGYLDIDSLSQYPNFNVTGAVIKKDDFIEVGGLKASLKAVFWYEFLLRILHNKHKVYTIPKYGYIHTLNRPDSYSAKVTESLTDGELDWYLSTAKEEYLYKKDRNKTYETE